MNRAPIEIKAFHTIVGNGVRITQSSLAGTMTERGRRRRARRLTAQHGFVLTRRGRDEYYLRANATLTLAQVETLLSWVERQS